MKKVRETIAKEIPAARVMDNLELMMGSDRKDDKSKEEAVRIHWSTDPVHANLHSYYKLSSNLLDYHKNFKSPSQEAAAGPKRARSSSSNADGAEDAGSGTNPMPRRGERTAKARRAGITEIPATGRRPAPPLPIRIEATPTIRIGTKTGTTTVTVAATAATVTRVTVVDVATGAAAADGPAGRPTTRWSGNRRALRRLPDEHSFTEESTEKQTMIIENFIVVTIFSRFIQ